MQITRDTCQNASSDSVGLGGSRDFCVTHKLPDDASAVGLQSNNALNHWNSFPFLLYHYLPLSLSRA